MSPRSVNLMAFPARLSRTCCNRIRSPTTASGVPSGIRQEKHSPFSLARTARTRVIWSNIRRRLKGADSSSSLPDSILAESSRSFRSVKSRSADPLAVCRQSWTVGSVAFGSATSIMPRMAFIGVRSSWLMLARNWLLASVGGLGGGLGLLRPLFGPLALGDVVGYPHQPHDLSLAIRDWHFRRQDSPQIAVCVPVGFVLVDQRLP